MSSTVPAGLVARGRGFYKPDQPHVLTHPVAHAPMARVTQPAFVPPPSVVFSGVPRSPAPVSPAAVPVHRPYYSAVVNGPMPGKASQSPVASYHHPEVIAPVLRQGWSPVAPRPHLGIMVEYKVREGKSQLALFNGPSGESSSWSLISAAGQRFSVSTEQILFVWPPSFMGQVYRYDVEDVERLEQMTANLVASYQGHLKIAWGSYLDRAVASVTPSLLAHFLFGSTPKPHETCAAHRLLLQDTLYFEAKRADTTSRHSVLMSVASTGLHTTGGTDLSYRCRSREEVNRIEKERKDSAYYDAKKMRFLERAKRRIAGIESTPAGTSSFPDADDDFVWRPLQDRVFIERLTAYALAEGEDADERTYIEIMMPLGCGPTARDAFDLLVRLGVWNRNQNLNVFKFKGPLAFNDADLKKFAQLSIRFAASSSLSDRDARLRRDFTKVQPVFAIDNESLAAGEDVEIDDGLAVERNEDGTSTVYVHIADPSRMMTLGDSLDRVARERVASIFLPETNFPMLPPPITSKHFSLLPNRINHTLTYVIRLSPEAEILSYEITPAKIAAVQCMNYEQADKVFAQTETTESAALHHLAALAEKRKAKRMSEGAIPGTLPNVDISVAPNGEDLRIAAMNTESVTRSLVQEFMILAGEVTADFATRHNIALPFRGQLQRHDAAEAGLEAPQPLSSVQLDLGWLTDMLSHWHRRSLLLPPFTSPDPKPHKGLGVRSYAQATSPIRRYTDLLVHYQIKAVLRGENPPLAKEKMSSLLNELEQRQQEVTRLQNHSQRYWILRHFEAQDSNRTYLALVLSVNTHQKVNNIHVVFLELGYKTMITLDPLPRSGEVLKLRVLHVDAFENDVIFVSV